MASLRKHLAFFAVLFAFGLVAASCGGSAAEPADAAPAATEAVTDTTVTEPPATEAPVETVAPEDDHDDAEDDDHADDDMDDMDDMDDGHTDDDDHDDDGHDDDGHDDDGHDDDGHDDDGHDDGETVEVPEDARVVFVFMNEYGFEPEEFTATPGETVVYRIVNTGFLPHEFRLSNAHRVEEHIESGHEGHGEDGGHHAEDGDVLVELEPGDSTELVVTFPMDMSVFTTVVCLLPDHYEKGMHAELSYS